jgi:hypothetical protein
LLGCLFRIAFFIVVLVVVVVADVVFVIVIVVVVVGIVVIVVVVVVLGIVVGNFGVGVFCFYWRWNTCSMGIFSSEPQGATRARVTCKYSTRRGG